MEVPISLGNSATSLGLKNTGLHKKCKKPSDYSHLPVIKFSDEEIIKLCTQFRSVNKNCLSDPRILTVVVVSGGQVQIRWAGLAWH